MFKLPIKIFFVVTATIGLGAVFVAAAIVLWPTAPITAEQILSSPTIEPPVKFLVVGDLFLDRNIRKTINTKGLDYPLAPLVDDFANYDFVIANLEGPVTENESVSLGSPIGDWRNTTFTFDPSALAVLTKANISIVSLANNHTDNYGAKGLSATVKFLTDAGIEFFGHPANAENLTLVKEVAGKKIAFVGHHDLWGRDPAPALAAITQWRDKVDLIIVYPHWGDEYQSIANARQQELAHRFVDAGADAVIGSHPHVIQNIEVYKNRPIFYSLGNFLFDQTFSVETQQSLAVAVTLQKDEVSYQVKPLATSDFQTSWADDQKATAIFDQLGGLSDLSIRDGLTFPIKKSPGE